MSSYVDAEQAFAEAVIHNPYDCYVWGYLSLLYALSSHLDDAATALKEALRLSLSDVHLLSEIAQQLMLVGMFIEAEMAGMRALVAAKEREAESQEGKEEKISPATGTIGKVVVKESASVSELRRIRRIMGDLYFSGDFKDKAANMYRSVVEGPPPQDLAAKTLITHCINQLAICEGKVEKKNK
jgi:tetratricopeptide (TPR) repeat protein